MKREWKPGDIAIRTWEGRHPQRAYVAVECGINSHDAGPHWHIEEHEWDPIGVEAQIANVAFRPLVVIDPEDREQVERLNDLLWATVDNTTATADMQAALREFANPQPPKPAEPQGLGAVVEDRAGALWIRHPGNIPPWHKSDALHDEKWRFYSAVDAVVVHSPGVVV